MTTRNWQNITDYMDTVGTTLKTFTFPKTQNFVNVTIRGNANVTYTIGSQSGTLTPGQSISVSEKITSFTLTAVSGTQTVEVWATEDGTQKVEDDSSDSISGLAAALATSKSLLPIDITQSGAVGDGSTDCLTAFNSIVSATTIDISSRISNKGLNVDSDANGVADGWTAYTDPGISAGSLSINNGQMATVTTSTAKGGKAVYQDIPATVGEVIQFKFTYSSTVTVGTFSPAITPVAVNDAGSTIQLFSGIYLPNASVDTDYQSGSYTIPAGATKLRIYLMAYANAIGDAGSATYKNLSMSKNGVISKPIKFPQNATNNATYYFSATPTLDNLKIDCDDGVILSFPTTNGISFKLVTFINNISIFSRDRNNTGNQYKNNFSDLLYNTLTDNEYKIGVNKLSQVADVNVSKNIYTANSTTVTAGTVAYDSTGWMYYMANTTDITHNLSKVVTTEFGFSANNMYTCDFEFSTPETSANACLGITASDANGNWMLYGLKLDGTFTGLQNISGVFSNFTARNMSSLWTDAYKLNTGIIFSARPIGNNMIEIFLNGVYIETITVGFTFTKIGFGMITVNQTNQGLQITKWGRIVTGSCLRSTVGNTLNIASFGDSITFGEGSLSWAQHLPRLLSGKKALTNVTVTNYAVSGNKSSDQLTKMQGVNLSGFDMVLILIGTNDIQSLIDPNTFKSNVQSMINLAKSTYRKVILGIPAVWISQTLTGVGATTSNFQKGAQYRSILMQLAVSNNLYTADIMSEIGRIGTDNVLNTLRDNLHPNEFGQVLIARCFTRSIMSALTADA